MIYRIEIRTKPAFLDPHAESVAMQIRELGIDSVKSINSARLMFLFGDLTADQAKTVAADLLIDPVCEEYCLTGEADESCESSEGAGIDAGIEIIEVHLQPGVMDPAAASACKAISDMGFDIDTVRTGRRYELSGLCQAEAKAITKTIGRRLLANAVIENTYFETHIPKEINTGSYELKIIEVPIRDLDDTALQALSENGDLFLNLTEMKAIQDYYITAGREPRDIELEMLAQTWSEHCGHKTFRSDVTVRDNSGNVVESFTNLLKTTVFDSTMELDKPWCLNVFADNAGVIEFDDENAVCFKVETHNHPSAIEPYGGSMTGIGGVVRDPMGTGLGSKPVANTDVFCFGLTDMPLADVPTGVLHPKRVMRGVVSGVRDYGNRMGIPTVNGAVYFDENYLGNPLVFCGTVGIMPLDKAKMRKPNPGDAIVCVGGRTGRDGIHGATFSSGELTHTHETEFSHAVQIGNAITEKKVLDTLLQAREKGLYSCITDCGAGGLSSAVGEMGEDIGARVHIDRIPLKYSGLSYDEIWISEAQERMTLAVPQENVASICSLFASEDVEATVIGVFGTDDAMLELLYDDKIVGELDMDFLHNGLPRPTKEAVYEKVDTPSPKIPASASSNDILLNILAQPNVASKEWVIRQYDHEVQGGSVIKPLVGIDGDGPGDAAVVRPVLDSDAGVVISCGMNPNLGLLDPYQSALHAVDEALRNAIAVGADLSRTAILDNFCWGNCNKPDRMGSFVQAAKACRDAALAFETPFVSGKDSLNNEFQTDDGKTIAILPTLLISAFSVITDTTKCITADAKLPGSDLYLLGITTPNLGGSALLKALNLKTGNDVPPVDLATSKSVLEAVQKAIADSLVLSCHDLSEGGLGVAAGEMAFSGGMGIEIDLVSVASSDEMSDITLLFAESPSRLLLEVAPENRDKLDKIIADIPGGRIGKITDTGRIIATRQDDKILDISISDAKQAWQNTFDW